MGLEPGSGNAKTGMKGTESNGRKSSTGITEILGENVGYFLGVTSDRWESCNDFSVHWCVPSFVITKTGSAYLKIV